MVGTATTEAEPDLAVLRLGVVSESADAAAAAKTSRVTLDAVIEAAKAQGIAASDIAPEMASLTKMFENRLSGTDNAVVHFSATEMIRVRLHNPARAGALAAILVRTGANRIEGIDYMLDDPESVLAKLTGAAVANARRRAESAALAADIKLGPVLQIERPDATAAGPVFHNFGGPTSQVGTLSTSVAVEVTFAIKP